MMGRSGGGCVPMPQSFEERERGMIKIFLDDGAILPTRAYPTDAGMDLYAREDTVIPGRGSARFDTGVHIRFDKGTYGKIESRSGLNMKNCVVSCGGTIDESYLGSIGVKLYNLSDESYEVHKGDRIAQLVIMRYESPTVEVVDSIEELGDTDRGANGFGSSGK